MYHTYDFSFFNPRLYEFLYRMFMETSDLWKDTQATDLYTLSVELGPEEASSRMHKHWQSWFTEADFETMANTYGVNQIRIPMGMYPIGASYRVVPSGRVYV
jgi:aryl-phospho-beta-D-glucosidase BglC (GH1 family)